MSLSKNTLDMSRLSRRLPLSLLVAFGIACIHFVITFYLVETTPNSKQGLMIVGLTAPSYIPYFLISSLAVSSPFTDRVFDLTPEALFWFQFIGTSSFFYGGTAGLLVSRKKHQRWIGILLCIGLLAGLIFVLHSQDS